VHLHDDPGDTLSAADPACEYEWRYGSGGTLWRYSLPTVVDLPGCSKSYRVI